MFRTPWQFYVALPVALIGLGFMLYSFRFFTPAHVGMLLTLLSDVTVLTIVLHVLVITLPDPVKRSALLMVPMPRTAKIIGSVVVLLIVLSICLHLFSGVPMINSKEYLLVGAIPVLLTVLNRFF